MTWTKRAQAGAAILIALIAVLIILYVLFLPGPDRAALLGESAPGTGAPGSGTNGPILLFSSQVGRVYVPQQPAIIHQLPTLPLRAIEQGSVLVSRDTMLVSNNVFQKDEPSVMFTAQPNLTRNAVLSLSMVSRTGGDLIIELNGVEVYHKTPASRAIPPISLSNLQETNVLTFKSSTVGFAFWQTNKISLAGMKVTADVTDLSAAVAQQHFTIGTDELAQMDRATLAFTPTCQVEGPVSILLNGQSVYDGTPSCDTMNSLEIAPSRLLAGENTVGWNTRKADLVLDQGKITTIAKQHENKAFSFTVNPAQVQGRPISLRIYFADARDKSGIVSLNGNTVPIQGGDRYALPITSLVRPGINNIQFEARGTEFELIKFEVVAG